MKTRWLEIRIAVPEVAADLVGQILTEMGSMGLIVGERQLDTFSVPDPHSFQNDPVLRAFFAYPDDPAGFRQQVLGQIQALQPFLAGVDIPEPEIRELADADWAHNWRQHFPPLQCGEKLVICPSWVEWPRQPGQVVLTLDPGQAFGTGTHATTGLCLELMVELWAGAQRPASVLDVGTGSGILAMAAAALGAEQVVGCDIDGEACRVARENIDNNSLRDRVTITERPLDLISGHFDLVLANILASENIRLAHHFLSHLKREGILLLSGILAEQENQVAQTFAPLPVTLKEVRRRDEWICMVYQRHG